MDILLKYFDDFTDTQLKKWELLFPTYSEWNAQINVISRKDIDSLYLKHVLHSLTIAAVADFQPGTNIVDIGCGGGFPGVPLAIFYPEVDFLLVDSIGKKLKVVEGVVEATGIKNIRTKHARIEEIKGQKFDYAVSRAVAPLADLWRWAKPILKKGHTQEMANGLICLKGGDLAQEISDSRLRPNKVDVYDIFPEEYFQEKYLLHVPA
ncbi:16S rRNA (guanine(527)-N(7))-methyltransferase RsmG [Rhizosphaericola mali]|uniref:Ribosomal RNA small subunit methyltransferase G n=1 Tax=Rhizosphaericola mali TaxID=2545455 RepID=A0A5P2G594_9BACT|nr:16S rRNA (guanine(527)-N(7))-methyltransferase RsmG [Rhizosphaericola mali]